MAIKGRLSRADIEARIEENIGNKGLKVKRFFTKSHETMYGDIRFDKRTSKITNADGSTVIEMKDVEAPVVWSQVATDILAQKYFRKRGVPQYDAKGKPLKDESGQPLLAGEKSIKQVANRLAGTWRHWGEKYGYFNNKRDAQTFEDEASWMIV